MKNNSYPTPNNMGPMKNMGYEHAMQQQFEKEHNQYYGLQRMNHSNDPFYYQNTAGSQNLSDGPGNYSNPEFQQNYENFNMIGTGYNENYINKHKNSYPYYDPNAKFGSIDDSNVYRNVRFYSN